jgi:hypothetical protein
LLGATVPALPSDEDGIRYGKPIAAAAVPAAVLKNPRLFILLFCNTNKSPHEKKSKYARGFS